MNNYLQACSLSLSLLSPTHNNINVSPIPLENPSAGTICGFRKRKMSFSSTSVPAQSLTFIVFCLLFVPFTEACASNGVCGGGCCGPTCPPSPVSCNQASCQPGYTCGHYGCARNKARSALTRKDGLIVPVDDFLSNQTQTPARNIYGFERRKTLSVGEEQRPPGTLDRGMYLKLTNPNFLFRQCCEDRRLPDTCLWKCHFNTYTKEVLQLMFFKNDPCPIEAAADLQYCAAQGRDHSECCAKVGIGKTVAGEKCLTFCDQRAGKLTKLDYSYLPCYDRFESMKLCFYEEIKIHMEAKLRPRLQGISQQ